MVLVYKIWMIRKIKNLSFAVQTIVEKNKDRMLSLEKEHLTSSENRPDVPNPFSEIFLILKERTLEVLNKNIFFAKQAGKENPVYLSIEDIDLIESSALTAVSTQTKFLEKNLFILSTIVTLAPFLGLLGTVWGILITFGQLHQGGSASSNSLILGGLSTALATTVLGLVIAIPALVSYNYLKNNAKKTSSDMEDFLYKLLSTIELQYRKNDA